MILRQACRASTRPALYSRASRIRCTSAPISEQIHSTRRDCTGCFASRTLHTSPQVISHPQKLLNCGSVHQARHYATHTDLPPTTSATSPPPSRKHKAPEFDIADVDEAIGSDLGPSDDPWADLYKTVNAKAAHQKNAAQDLEEIAAIEALLSFAEEMAEGSTFEQPLKAPRTTLNAKLPARIPLRPVRKSLMQVKPTSLVNASKTISQQTFEEFRVYHREQQYRIDYTWHGEPNLSEPAQPHHKSLLSRYDWRLRNPWRTPNQEQKHQYALANIYLNENVAHSETQLPGLDKYQEKYLEYIRLERDHAEQETLTRLRRTAGRLLPGAAGARGKPVESISGLKAALHETRGPTKSRNSTPGQTYHFALPLRGDLPTNAFHKGAMVFIWECHFDSFLHEWVVPDLKDPDLTAQELYMEAGKGFVEKDWANRIDIRSETWAPKPGAFYRIDVGYDGTTFDRMEKAIRGLALDTAAQRNANEASSLGPHVTQSHMVGMAGTELRKVILDYKQMEKFTPTKEHESAVLMDDQYIASWARRYSRVNPIRMPGDPDLRLNDTQLRAVANAIMNKFSLIQGPPGTGKTATIVAALKLLKLHFQIASPVLVCAHTNVVVDMIVDKCAQEGLRPLRLGRQIRIREDLQHFGLEHQIATHPEQSELMRLSGVEDSLRARKSEINDLLINKGIIGATFADLEDSQGDVKSKVKTLTPQERNKLKAEIDRIDRDFKTTRVQYNKLLRTVQADIIYSSDVCLSTCLSSVGYEAASTDFPIVFVDEAGQCDEPMTLIPLTKGSRHVVLIGDHKQLPAVCSSAKARWKGLNSSLFERLNFQASVPSIQLDVQYRMLPDISAFPNEQYYGGSIRDSEERQMSGKARADQTAVTFFHHTHRETSVGHSTANEEEADGIIRLLSAIKSERVQAGVSTEKALSHVGVIVMYGAQTTLITDKAKEVFGPNHGIEIHTVDGFQGRDKDTIIISTVRSNTSGKTGFLKDARRLNVALTRARNQLYVFGNATTLNATDWQGYPTDPSKYIQWLRKKKFIRDMQ